ncbi:alpha-N-arabinofuranosidase [Scatolibacter rhodanostii]|uniref:alpha-N-arabinofuranosidase n=1 Tax=Scatolibacter rhodanostii TaxID=2014781 RepID=UPI000C085495|nr:alpha-L-arabinofuranosidase C-terminal domain-containing protein [Scatolibacter rhodanostii]
MNRWIINPLCKKAKINKAVYGHFSEHLGRCIYQGIYVGTESSVPNVNGIRKDVVEALKEMRIPVLRWPGGCFADQYHWRDGIGPKEQRKKIVNTNWGGVVEDNTFGTHEFMELCTLLGCDAYINGNVGSGTVQEMSDWVEYLTSGNESPLTQERCENGQEKPWDVAYWAIGNENWGCGGHMIPEQYAYEYRKYSAYCRHHTLGKKLYRVACGADGADYNWTENLMKVLSVPAPFGTKLVEGVSVHYYTTTGGWDYKGSATEFTDKEYYSLLSRALFMDELLRRHTHVMDRYDPNKEIGLVVDEWGTWYEVEPGTNPSFLYQQNTMRDALVAALTLNIFHKHADRVHMANLAQIVNVLQSVILTEGDKMVKTPTYHVFRMFSPHQDSTVVDSFIETKPIGMDSIEIPNLHESVSVSEEGILNLSICNLSATESFEVQSILVETNISEITASILTEEPHAYNTFDKPETVEEQPFTDFIIQENKICFSIPACSIIQFAVK